MNIQILHMIEGAKKATGVTVVIDVFRAFTVEAYLMAAGAETIIPVGDIDFAYQYKQLHPDVLLAGERHGVMCEGFDFGNAPSQISQINPKGKTVVHTTSAGTQGIANAQNAEILLTGSLVNAKAVARYIRQLDPKVVSLVCMGLEGVAEAEEDTLCAEYIRSILLDEPMELKERIEYLKLTTGAKFFNPAKNDVFPEEDFAFCTQVDKFDFVLKVEKNTDGLHLIRKITVQ